MFHVIAYLSLAATQAASAAFAFTHDATPEGACAAAAALVYAALAAKSAVALATEAAKRNTSPDAHAGHKE